MKSTTQNQTEPAIVTGLTTNGAPAPTGGAAATDTGTPLPQAEVGEIEVKNDPFTEGLKVGFTVSEASLFATLKKIAENVINNLTSVGKLKGSPESIEIIKRIAINLVAITVKNISTYALRREAAVLYLDAKLTLPHGMKMEFFETLKLAFEGKLDLALRDLNRDIEAIRQWLGIAVWRNTNQRQPDAAEIGLIKPISPQELKLAPDYYKQFLTTDEFKKEFDGQDFQKRYGCRPPTSTVQKRLIKGVEQLKKLLAELEPASAEALKLKTQIPDLVDKLGHEVIAHKNVIETLVAVPTVEPPVAAPPVAAPPVEKPKPKELTRG